VCGGRGGWCAQGKSDLRTRSKASVSVIFGTRRGRGRVAPKRIFSRPQIAIAGRPAVENVLLASARAARANRGIGGRMTPKCWPVRRSRSCSSRIFAGSAEMSAGRQPISGKGRGGAEAWPPWAPVAMTRWNRRRVGGADDAPARKRFVMLRL